MSAINQMELINNIVAICIVIISLTASTSSILEEKKRLSRLMGLIIVINIAIDMIGFYTVGRGFKWAYECGVALNTVNLIVRMMTAYFLAFQQYKIRGYRISKSPIKEALIMGIPVMIGCVFLLFNLFNERIFSVSSDGHYTTNGGIFVIHGIAIIYLFFTIIISLLGSDNVGNYPFVPMIVLVIPIMIGVIIRGVFLPEVPVGFLGASISLLIFVISMSKAGIFFDSFTGVYNKEYITLFLDKVKKDRFNKIVGIMIDVNDLKKTNDKYGHKAGDDIIMKTVKLVSDINIENSSLVRYGGDEFILLISISNIDTVKNVMLDIKERLTEYDSKRTVPYKLSLSMGMTVYIPGESINSFVRRMDEQMYFEKKAYHEAMAQ